ncbi:MAG: hypothetical protein PHV28_15195, partial [Kiritimatiellae bacterium]|nr:hypothetical protein [Kiritimatiellia bacterium]
MNKIPPVLLMGFNRPDMCAVVFDVLRKVRPKELFFAVDGPRANHPEDTVACQATRDLAHLVDWPCSLHTLFQSRNKGCRFAPPAAISWFFDFVPYGIVLEDDCVPSLDFFPFAQEMLTRYASEHRIGMVSGNNHYGFQTDQQTSYHFSRHTLLWGWATWARAWRHYDIDMSRYSGQLDAIRATVGHTKRFRSYWWRYIKAVQEGLDAWDIQWAVALLANRQLSVSPATNLVANIGFTYESTHTGYDCDAALFSKISSIKFPLVHPETIECDELADWMLEQHHL